MSRGLGIAQRQLLGALYTAPFQGLTPWDIDWDDPWDAEDDDHVVYFAEPRHRAGAGPEGAEFYMVAQLHLAENRDPVLRDSPSRSIRETQFGSKSRSSAGEELATAQDRARLRSWRALYRRAARSLADREFIEIADCLILLDHLGQSASRTWIYDRTVQAMVFNESAEPALREALLAAITEDGRVYVGQHRAGLVTEDDTTDDLRHALRAAGYLDIDEPPLRPPIRRKRTRRRRGRPAALPQKKAAVAEPPESTEAISIQSVSRDQVVAMLESEGHDRDRIGAALRAWHRDEQRYVVSLGGSAGPLSQRLFDLDDLDELRTRLT